MGAILAFIKSNVLLAVAMPLITAILGIIMKKIPNDKIKGIVGPFCRGLGVATTLGCSRWKVTKKLWNSTIEPFFIDLLDNTLVHGINEYIAGLRHDNP